MKIKEGIDLIDYVENFDAPAGFAANFRRYWNLFFQLEHSDVEKGLALAKKYGKYAYKYTADDQPHIVWSFEDKLNRFDELAGNQVQNPFYVINPFMDLHQDLTYKLRTQSLRDFEESRKHKTKISGYTESQIKRYKNMILKREEIEDAVDSEFKTLWDCESIFYHVIAPILDVDKAYTELKRVTERCEHAKKRCDAIFHLINNGTRLEEITWQDTETLAESL